PSPKRVHGSNPSDSGQLTSATCCQSTDSSRESNAPSFSSTCSGLETPTMTAVMPSWARRQARQGRVCQLVQPGGAEKFLRDVAMLHSFYYSAAERFGEVGPVLLFDEKTLLGQPPHDACDDLCKKGLQLSRVGAATSWKTAVLFR